MAWGVEGGAHRVEAVPDRHGRNVRRNMGSPGSPVHRRNGNPPHQGGPAASGKCARSNPARRSCPPFRGLALRAQGGEAVQVGWVLVDRRDPDA